MSDDGLDDFFAKKDKSKKKTKASKFTPADVLDQQQEDPGKVKKKKKKKKEKDSTEQSASAEAEANKKKEDDEWIDYEQETEKDYTGLRIQNLQISKEEDEGKDTADDNDDEDGENGEKREGAQGPWNKIQQSAATVIAEPTPQPEPEKPKEEPKSVGKYVPPSRRGLADSSASSSSAAQKRRSKKTAPNIQSEEDFPTLGGAGIPDCDQTDLSSFERVRSGKRQDDNISGVPARVEIGNKFDALSRGDGM